MNDDKWTDGQVLTRDEEPEYLKELCEYLRKQQTLSGPTRNSGTGMLECELVPDDLTAHAADIIEELWDRIEKLEYELREAKAQ